MLFKKNKAVIAAVLSAAMAANAMIATMGASAAGTRTKAEAFGDSTYAERFLSLYDDVVTNGVDNGYLSGDNIASGGFGVPYHAVEEVIVEAPDYGHVTTSEAMSYLVWVAAMRDNIAKNHADQVSTAVTNTNDLAKAWKTMETMIPTEQTGFWSGGTVSAQYCGEYDDPKDCAEKFASEASKTAENPIYSLFTSAYSGEKGLYLMHWLADVDNWYGYGTGYKFTFINTFQRGEQESCWETVPHPCVEDKKWGNPQRGLKGIFNKDAEVAAQYAYTNAPDAEDRAIQGVYDANKWGVGDSSVTTLAAKMGDELRNNMYDKYYQEISKTTSWSNGNAGEKSAHYLMNWYTSWGGALNGDWKWQIGCSHAHQFYQNPLAAYGLITEDGLKSGMKAQGAVDDYKTSLKRQVEFYQWLQSADGPFAGGATNSYKGRYETYPSGISTFYDMMYVEHPVYADPGSNHWTGNQVWSTQRLAELYYWVKEDGNASLVEAGGMSLEAALEKMLDKWVAWFVNNTVLTEDGDFYMPSNLNWSGQPDEWNQKPTDNTGLTCTITGYGNTDFGCISSLANTLIYYAKAKGVTAEQMQAAGLTEASVGGSYKSGIDNASAKAGTKVYKNSGDADLPVASLYLAQQLMDRIWEVGRDNIGLTRTDHNGSFARMFAQTVWVPMDYTGTMPNGDTIKNGIKFLDIRSMYTGGKCAGKPTSPEAVALVKELQKAYELDVASGANFDPDLSASSVDGGAQLAEFKNVAAVDLQYHRFWHAGDILMSLGVMTNLYPELKPGDAGDVKPPVGDILYGDTDCNGAVNLLDVVLLNKHLMLGAKVEDQGKINADVDLNEQLNPTDSLNILKYCVKLIDLPVTD